MAINDGGPAFPPHGAAFDHIGIEIGMSLRDYFAIHAPAPDREDIRRIMESERMANPHNEPYHNKVRRRDEREIICDLRYRFADAMLKARASRGNE